MVFHPSVQLEIARQRREDLLTRAERHRLEKAALARRRDRGRLLTEPPPLHEPSPTTTASHPQRANA